MEKDITYQKSEPYLTFLFVILTKNYNLYSKQFFHHITLYKKQITEKNNQVLGVCKRTYRRVSVQTEKETLPPFPIVSRELEQKRLSLLGPL